MRSSIPIYGLGALVLVLSATERVPLITNNTVAMMRRVSNAMAISVPTLRRVGDTCGAAGASAAGATGVVSAAGGSSAGASACSTGRGGVGRTMLARGTIGMGSVGV